MVPDEAPFFDNYSAGLQASGNSQVWFDNIVISEIPDTTPTPSPTPTELPTPSPGPVATVSPTESSSPIPTQVALIVPNLKQYSKPWKNKKYDHIESTIGQFGCALTSASMVLQYYGYHIFPDKLNAWLRNEPDGYIRSGLLNWLAISRYTKEYGSLVSPTLEYKRLQPTKENLDTELINNRPAILKEDGHFVVATGKSGPTYSINDPGYADRTDLSAYGNSFLSIDSYTPTHSDLSYMMFVTEPDTSIELSSFNGDIVPGNIFVENALGQLNSPNKKSGSPIKIALFEKPKNGKYLLKIYGTRRKYQLDSYLYTTSGLVTQNSFIGNLRGNDRDIYNINYEKINEIKEVKKGNEEKSKYMLRLKHFFDRFHKWK